MAVHSAETIPAHLLMWRRVREYAVPPSMIANATVRRAAGDWAGACAAARIDVDLDLRAVRHRHGTPLAALLRDDLRRLAPDLLRWHMPRTAPDGRLRPGLTLTLARYGPPGTGAPHLVVRTPPAWADAGQRMSLALWEDSHEQPVGHHPHPHPDRRFRLDLHRHLWDATRGAELARRCGAAGAAPATDASGPPGDDSARLPPHWTAEAELLLRDAGTPRGALTVRLGTRSRAVLELTAPDDHHAPVLRALRTPLPAQRVAVLPVLPEAAVRPLPDLELLRAGLFPSERLHPLVVAALATVPRTPTGPPPDTGRDHGGGTGHGDGTGDGGRTWDVVGTWQDAGEWHDAGPGHDAGPVHDPEFAAEATDPHRVPCGGAVHRIALRDGSLTAVDHEPAELAREELLMALGGPGLPCLRAIDDVHRSPEALPAVRDRLGHGDVTGAMAVVEGLLGPAAVLRDGPLRDVLEAAVAGRLDQGLFRAGLVRRHPATGITGEHGHRPRVDRSLPGELRRVLGRRRDSRGRPRTVLRD
ncbi:hypothetical protein [Streptomyces sp. NPDC097619]|uniref:hypothetical protein n=1 Tax=Streptomyces sp. NPDC097619 TaxID=3157228 RepID=UPI00331EDD12